MCYNFSHWPRCATVTCVGFKAKEYFAVDCSDSWFAGCLHHAVSGSPSRSGGISRIGCGCYAGKARNSEGKELNEYTAIAILEWH